MGSRSPCTRSPVAMPTSFSDLKVKKEKTDREEIFDALQKLGHEPSYFELDGKPQSLHSLSRCDADLIFRSEGKKRKDRPRGDLRRATEAGARAFVFRVGWEAAVPALALPLRCRPHFQI